MGHLGTLSIHRKIASWLHIAVGALIAALTSTLWICYALLAPVFDGSFIPGLVAMFGWPVAVALLAFATLEVAAAVALLRRRRWARFALYGVGAAQLVIFPISTALTIYTLWALIATDLSDTTRPNSSRPGAC